jgi:hypothetical protein
MIESSSSNPIVKAFCVGQAKSGTASLCGLLATRYRAAHEPEREEILDMIRRESRGEIDESAVSDYLIRRDQRLNLEYDIAWANQFIIGHLLAVFPEAKFVVLVRDPYTWLQSIIGHLISRQIPRDVRSFLDWWFGPERYPHTRNDHELKTCGVYSIEALLNAWNRHVDACTLILQRDRRLIVRTHELNQSYSRLAEFLEIPVESLDVQGGHLNRSVWSGQLESLLDRKYLDDMVWQVCGDNMVRYFPEVSGVEDVSKLWSVTPKPDRERPRCEE